MSAAADMRLSSLSYSAFKGAYCDQSLSLPKENVYCTFVNAASLFGQAANTFGQGLGIKFRVQSSRLWGALTTFELGTLNGSSMCSASPIYALRRSPAFICEAPSRRIMVPRSDNDFLGHPGINRFFSVSRRIEREKHRNEVCRGNEDKVDFISQRHHYLGTESLILICQHTTDSRALLSGHEPDWNQIGENYFGVVTRSLSAILTSSAREPAPILSITWCR